MKEEVGMTIKEILQTFRFNYVLQNFDALSYQTLTELSYLSGYFDQSHFIKDFKRITGKIPKLLMEDVKFGKISSVDKRTSLLIKPL